MGQRSHLEQRGVPSPAITLLRVLGLVFGLVCFAAVAVISVLRDLVGLALSLALAVVRDSNGHVPFAGCTR